ncbi:MAG: PAS domain-containing protein [Acidobacteriota bacterium]
MGEGESYLVDRWVRRLVPGGIGRAKRRQARLALGTAAGLGVTVLAGTLLRLFFGGPISGTAIAIVAGVVASVATVPIFLRFGRVDWAGAATSTAFLAMVLGSGWNSGGLEAPIFLLLPAVPLLATFLIGPQAGLYTTTILLGFVVVLAFAGPGAAAAGPGVRGANDLLARALMCGLSLLVVGFFAAATEQQRQRSDRQRRRSHGLYRRLFTQSKDVVVISTPEGRVVDVNPAGLQLYGLLPFQEAAEFDLRNLYVDPAEREEIRRRLEREGIVRDFLCRHRTLDGRELHVLLTTSAIQNGAGEVTYWLSTVRETGALPGGAPAVAADPSASTLGDAG